VFHEILFFEQDVMTTRRRTDILGRISKRWLKVSACALLALAASRSSLLADEGMWTFDNFPSSQVNAKYGTRIDQAWLDRIRGAAVRLSSGCSASLVTANGLVLTNHHCVRDCAQQLSDASADYVKDGFIPARREDEKLCPGMVAEILTSIGDVTSRIVPATAGKTGQVESSKSATPAWGTRSLVRFGGPEGRRSLPGAWCSTSTKRASL